MSPRRRLGPSLALVTLIAGSVALAAPAPAGATALGVTATTAGSVVNIDLTGDGYVNIFCDALGQVKVNSTVATPVLACDSVTSVHITGDDGATYINDVALSEVDNFGGLPNLIASLTGGADVIWETRKADSITMGAGDDSLLLLSGGVANTQAAMNAGTGDTLYVDATEGDDTMTVTATNVEGRATVAVTTGAVVSSSTATSVEYLTVRGGGGDDTIDASGVGAGTNLTGMSLFGDAGNDDITAGAVSAYIGGGSGTNTLVGGPESDQLWSSSETDTVNSGAGVDTIYDADSLRSGGRIVTGPDNADAFYSYHDHGDAYARVRPGASAGTATITAALTRPGIQSLGASTTLIGLTFDYVGEKPDRGVADVQALDKKVTVGGGDADTYDLLDVTVPSGGWTTSGSLDSYYSIYPNDPAYKEISTYKVANVKIHGPWTNKNQGFGHRVIRDLYLRFATDVERDTIRNALTAGTKTRAQIVNELIATDEYRGLDVDRTFLKFLRRQSDAGGRTYWINAIAGGRSLQKFRAQLFGSNEYYTKAGGTDYAFVTKAYQDVLGRQPDPSGATYWVDKIGSGTGRGTVAEQFLATAEARRAIVTDQYLRFLGRNPTTPESNAGVTQIGASATGEQQLIAGLAASTTYYNRD